MFFNMMGGEPDTLITDQEKTMIATIQDMKNEGETMLSHMHDSWHFMKSLKPPAESKNYSLENSQS
jgi:hypothetical protein